MQEEYEEEIVAPQKVQKAQKGVAVKKPSLLSTLGQVGKSLAVQVDLSGGLISAMAKLALFNDSAPHKLHKSANINTNLDVDEAMFNRVISLLPESSKEFMKHLYESKNAKNVRLVKELTKAVEGLRLKLFNTTQTIDPQILTLELEKAMRTGPLSEIIQNIVENYYTIKTTAAQKQREIQTKVAVKTKRMVKVRDRLKTEANAAELKDDGDDDRVKPKKNRTENRRKNRVSKYIDDMAYSTDSNSNTNRGSSDFGSNSTLYTGSKTTSKSESKRIVSDSTGDLPENDHLRRADDIPSDERLSKSKSKSKSLSESEDDKIVHVGHVNKARIKTLNKEKSMIGIRLKADKKKTMDQRRSAMVYGWIQKVISYSNSIPKSENKDINSLVKKAKYISKPVNIPIFTLAAWEKLIELKDGSALQVKTLNVMHATAVIANEKYDKKQPAGHYKPKSGTSLSLSSSYSSGKMQVDTDHIPRKNNKKTKSAKSDSSGEMRTSN